MRGFVCLCVSLDFALDCLHLNHAWFMVNVHKINNASNVDLCKEGHSSIHEKKVKKRNLNFFRKMKKRRNRVVFSVKIDSNFKDSPWIGF